MTHWCMFNAYSADQSANFNEISTKMNLSTVAIQASKNELYIMKKKNVLAMNGKRRSLGIVIEIDWEKELLVAWGL